MTTVTDLQKSNQLYFRRGDYNIIDCGVRTGKTYWAINNLKQFSRDGKLNRILILTDTLAAKAHLLTQYPDSCTEANFFWENEEEMWPNEEDKIGVMCYQTLGAKILKARPKFLEYIDVICWDECDKIFDFAASAFAKARKYDFAKQDLSNAEVLDGIQRLSTKPEYMPLVLLGVWEELVRESRIMCIGLSATPERAYKYYRSLTSASYAGKLQASYRALEDIYFSDAAQHIKELQPEAGRGYWCYSRSIRVNQHLVQIAKQQGFNAIEIHSLENPDYPSTPEQQRVYHMISQTGMVPIEYDFVIVNAAIERSVSLVDQRFDQLIVNSLIQSEREQAGRQTFPYTRHIKVWAREIPEEYLNKWLSIEQCRELAETLSVPEVNNKGWATGKIITWNKLKKVLPLIGYQTETKRKYIKRKSVQMYRITGEWHDISFEEADFLGLAQAKMELDEEIKKEEA